MGYSFYGSLARRSPAHNEEQQTREREVCTGEGLILTRGGGRYEREEEKTLDDIYQGESVALEEGGLSVRVEDDLLRGDLSGERLHYKKE